MLGSVAVVCGIALFIDRSAAFPPQRLRRGARLRLVLRARSLSCNNARRRKIVQSGSHGIDEFGKPLYHVGATTAP
jgi:hypothetical protein